MKSRKIQREYYLQILFALQSEIYRNEGHLKALKSTKQTNLIHLLSLEVGKFYLNNILAYKFSGVQVAEIWAYMESIRKVKSVSQEDSIIDEALKLTSITINSIEKAKENYC